MKKLFLLMPVFLAMLVTGCLKEDPNSGTIVLMGTESEVKPVDSIVGMKALLSYLKDSVAMVLPEGNMPPDIQGEFVFAPMELFKYNYNEPIPNDSLFVRFGGKISEDSLTYENGQHNRLVPCDIRGDVLEKGDEDYKPKRVEEAFVMGKGKEFTVYFTMDYKCEYGGVDFDLTRGYVITGTMTPEGIDHAVMACVNIEVSDAVSTMKDCIYVYRVKGDAANPFGMAVKYPWYQN